MKPTLDVDGRDPVVVHAAAGGDTKRTLACLLAAWAAMLPGAAAQAEELRLYAAAAVKAPLERIAADFEKAGGGHVSLALDTAGAAETRFLADPGAGLLATSAARLRSAQAAGRLGEGRTVPIGATVGGFAVSPGAAKPDISTEAGLRRALLGAQRIAVSDPARGATVGRHFMEVIEALGIRDAVMKKVVLAPNGIETMHLVAAGKADLGVTQVSEIVQTDPACLLGPFPGRFDLATDYAIWLRADAPAAAKAFAALAEDPAERARLRGFGLREPK